MGRLRWMRRMSGSRRRRSLVSMLLALTVGHLPHDRACRAGDDGGPAGRAGRRSQDSSGSSHHGDMLLRMPSVGPRAPGRLEGLHDAERDAACHATSTSSGPTSPLEVRTPTGYHRQLARYRPNSASASVHGRAHDLGLRAPHRAACAPRPATCREGGRGMWPIEHRSDVRCERGKSRQSLVPLRHRGRSSVPRPRFASARHAGTGFDASPQAFAVYDSRRQECTGCLAAISGRGHPHTPH
jgi:hypothetical protein